jgi:hypothetical protein
MLEERQGLFALPQQCHHYQEILQQLFPTMSIVVASEREALQANQIATEEAVKMMTLLEMKCKEAGLPVELCNQSLEQTVRGVAKAYVQNDLGEFAKEIIQKVRRRKEDET